MKVKKIEEGLAPKLIDGTLPDIDTDFCSTDRPQVKAYIEERFGESQVCSVGTFTTMKMKGVVKDLARIASVDFNEANIITSIIQKEDKTMLDLFKRAAVEPNLKTFIKDNSEIFYMLPTLLKQPKTKSIHPCAMIIFPSVMESKEWVPLRFQQGQMVSEWSGYEMDDAGFLKEDILGIKQLDKFKDILSLIKKNGKEQPDIYELPHDKEVFRYFGNGWNGDVFQMGSPGLTEYTKALKPQVLDDLAVAISLYRPGPMNNGYHEIYVKCKNEGRKPEYLWGTKEITRKTFGLLVYQEQIMELTRELGGLTMKEADDVRRAMGKLKLHALLEWEKKVEKGFLERGATKEIFKNIWETVKEFAKYCFNRSHAIAYAKTGYISQYLKVHFPIEYWTVALSYASEEDTLNYLSEITQADVIEVKSPDINKSGINMSADQESSSIFWGLGSIKGIGEATAMQIINERKKNGPFKSFEDFLERSTFKGSKVKKQTYEGLITAGTFDELYKLKGSETKRHLLIKQFRETRKVRVANPTRDIFTIGECDKLWWWKLQEKKFTSLAFIDYKPLAKEEGINTAFCTFNEFNSNQERGIFRAFGGYIVEIKRGRSKKGEYARITVEHNYKLFKLLLWSDEYAIFKEQLKGAEKALIVFSGEIRYDAKWTKGNQFTLKSNSQLKVLK